MLTRVSTVAIICILLENFNFLKYQDFISSLIKILEFCWGLTYLLDLLVCLRIS